GGRIGDELAELGLRRVRERRSGLLLQELHERLLIDLRAPATRLARDRERERAGRREAVAEAVLGAGEDAVHPGRGEHEIELGGATIAAARLADDEARADRDLVAVA